MFSPGGQLDLLSFHGVYGGGKGGGGSDNSRFESKPIVLTDPVNGKSFVQETNPYLLYMQPNNGRGPSAQDQLNAEIAQRQADEKAASDQATAQKQQDAATAENTFQTNRQNAYNDALQATIRQFQQQGLDPQQYMESDIKPALQRQFNSIQDLDPNPSAAFTPNLGQTIIGDLTSGRRTQANTSLNSLFSPTYATDVLPDSTMTGSINTILGEQFDPLSAQLVNAQKRGTLNDAGYKAAVDALNQKRSAAQSTLTSLGQNILSGERSDIGNIISGARSAAGSLGLNDAWDPSVYGQQAASKVASDVAGFGGALRSGLGDTQFANITDLLNAGGAVQGATDPTAANPNAIGGAGTVPDPNDPTQQKRGLGNVGAF